ncbi:hypothetical protein B0H13DRAFT_2662362 [Mycena leptocephala]|nr:hypothetical protein B0H13DRAFT_2662362 [Mycena leptocephala]
MARHEISSVLASILVAFISLFLYRSFTSMPSLSTVRAFNAAFSPSAWLRPLRATQNAHIVLVGRNRAAAESIPLRPSSFKNSRLPGVHITNIRRNATITLDVGTFKPRPATCSWRAAAIPKDETMEGNSEPQASAVALLRGWWLLHQGYLLPAVEAAKEGGRGPGKGGSERCLRPGGGGQDWTSDLAARQPALTFIHAHPGVVASNLYKSSNMPLVRAANTFLAPLLAPFIYSVQSAGEHQLYALLKTGPGAVRTGPKGDDIGLTKGYFGSKEAMERLWAHTEEATKA